MRLDQSACCYFVDVSTWCVVCVWRRGAHWTLPRCLKGRKFNEEYRLLFSGEELCHSHTPNGIIQFANNYYGPNGNKNIKQTEDG